MDSSAAEFLPLTPTSLVRNAPARRIASIAATGHAAAFAAAPLPSPRGRWGCLPILLLLELLWVSIAPRVALCVQTRTLLELPEPIVSVAVAGDRWLVVAEQRLHWYRAHGAQLREEGTWQVPSGLTCLRGDWSDVTGDGRPEVLVTARRGRQLASFILTRVGDTAWQPLATGLTWYLRVVSAAATDEPAVLVGQQQSEYRAFAGPVVRLRWRDRGLHADGVFPLPRGTAIYHFTQSERSAVWVATANGATRQWRQDAHGRWASQGRLATRLRGVSGVVLPAPAREFGGGSTPGVTALPLLPWIAGEHAIVPVQRPFLNGIIGRSVAADAWELLRVPAQSHAASAAPIPHTSGQGQLQQLVPGEVGLLAVVQYGREELLSAEAVRSAILAIQ